VKNLENVINSDIRHFFENGNLYPNRLENLAEDALKWKIELDKTTIAFAAGQRLYKLIHDIQPRDADLRLLDLILRIFTVMDQLEIEVDLWEIQNEYFSRGKSLLDDHSSMNFRDQKSKLDWIRKYLQLGIHVKVKLPARMEEMVK